MPAAVGDCEAFICQAKIRKLRKRKALIQRTNGNSFWVMLAGRAFPESILCQGKNLRLTNFFEFQ